MQVASIEAEADLRCKLDGVARQIATDLLGWLTQRRAGEEAAVRAQRLVCRLASRAAAEAVAAGQQQAARHLHLMAGAAVNVDDADLRALVLADVAAEQATAGHISERLAVLRPADGDGRVSESLRLALKQIRKVVAV
jgi:hypothetical protein